MDTEIIQSFKVKDSLNPKIWDNYSNPKKAKLKKRVLGALNKISDEFIDFLGEDVFVDDIILTGSLSNFNWSKFSDFDLHIVIDFSQYEKQSKAFRSFWA